MIILLDRARRCYDLIIKKLSKNKKAKVIIFCSASVDSLASLRILVELLKADIVSYEVVPIMNYNELDEQIEVYKSKKIDIGGIIMINCVGEIDLTNYWFCGEESTGLICLVVDSRRPSNHNNIYNQTNITLINDTCYNFEDCPTDEEMKMIENIDDNYFEELEEKQQKKKKIKQKKHDFADEEEESNKELKEEDEEENIGEKAEKDLESEGEEEKEEEDQENKKLRQKYILLKNTKEKIERYYSGSFYGYPSAYIFYNIACQLHKEDSKFLWYLIIAITDEFIRYHFSLRYYDELYAFCQKEVLKLSQQKKHRYVDEGERFASTAKEVKSIVISSDYRLYLYRHWNLYDSFIYSNYPLGVLSTWKEQGRTEIRKLFAYIGLPLTEVKQKYRYMKSEFKENFRNKIPNVSKIFDMGDLIFHSFTYQFDQNTEMSASDCVYLTSALLEYPFDDIVDLEIEDDEGNNENFEENKEEEEGDKEGKDEKLNTIKQNKLKKFWLAYRFLSLKKLNMTNSLIDLAIKFQIALANTATAVIDKNGVTNTAKNMRYSIIASNLTDESKYFHSSGNLEMLGLTIMEIFIKTRSKKPENKHFVLAMFESEREAYYVDGILGNNREFDDEKNEFGIKFKFITKKQNLKAQYDFCTDDIITVQKEDLIRFIDGLLEI